MKIIHGLKSNIFRILLATAVGTHCLSNAHAQQIRVVNGTPNVQSAGDLASALENLRSSGMDQWAAYAVPAAPGTQLTSNLSSALVLRENTDNSGLDGVWKTGSQASQITFVLHYKESKLISVRFSDTRSAIDANGGKLNVLTDVTEVGSVRALIGLARSTQDTGLQQQLLWGVGLHASPDVTPSLKILVENPDDASSSKATGALRLAAAAALAAHDPNVTSFLEMVLRGEPDSSIRRALTFDISMVRNRAALDALRSISETDPSPDVRAQAQFWLNTKNQSSRTSAP